MRSSGTVAVPSLAALVTCGALAASGAEQQQREPQRAAVNFDQVLNQRNGRARRWAQGRQMQAIHEPFRGPITAAKIRRAVDDAVSFLRANQRSDGSIGSYANGGSTALAALAILAAGGSPASDESLRKALDWLAKLDVDNTYVRAVRANVWEYALRKVPYDEGIREALRIDYEWLMKALGKKTGWRYNMSSRDWDNSCTQYGVLGLWAAARAGMDPGDDFWRKMSKHFRTYQNTDGGWGYTARSRSSPNMATAGLASMFLVFDMHHGRSFYSAENPRTFTSGKAAEVLASIERGMEWLGKSEGNKDDGYYLYGIERTGVASGRKYIGGEDWFRRGAQAVLTRQGRQGEIMMAGHGDAVVKTSFCTLFLVYGGAPVAFNKLEHGRGHDWNLNPRDVANLTKHLWSAYERPLNWHSVSMDAPASEFEAPILFLSGSEAVSFGEEDALKLREYVERGGTILAEPTDRSEAFKMSMRALVRLMFPEKDYPSYELAPLPADHGVYTVVRQDWESRPRLLGVSDGSRTFFMLSEEYMSADWQMNRTESDAFKLAMNLLFYATDLGAIEGKFATVVPDTEAAEDRKRVVTVARVKFQGTDAAPLDWDAGKMSWKGAAPYVKHVTGYRMEERPPVDPGTDALGNFRGIHVLHMTGRRELRLSEPQRRALKQYVEDGGCLLVDAHAGSPEFAASARRELERTFGKLAPLAADSVLASGRFLGGADLTRNVSLKLSARRLLRERGLAPRGQKLKVATVGGRPAVVFSEFDRSVALAGIESFRAVGYKPRSACQIAANVLAYVAAD
ncbi:MAG: DUF4159 domain-containing protein [Planctomycetota bacterium]